MIESSDNKPNSLMSTSPKYWMSLEQWRQDPEFIKIAESEFRSSPMAEGKESGWARREFLKVMGASLALSSFGCVRRPAQKIVPYVKAPMDVVQGIANYYASSFSDGSEGFGIVVTTREGRPFKIEGNPDHPVNKGSLSARALSHVLSLYDPDRLTEAKENLLNETKSNRDTVGVPWESLDKRFAEELKKGRVGILTGSIVSPSTRALMSDFASAFNVKQYVWDPVSYEAVTQGQEASYGDAVVPRYKIDQAKYMVAVDCDFLGSFGHATQAQSQFVGGRKPGKDMSKLVVFESTYSLTGTNSDERFMIKPSQQLDVLVGLLMVVATQAGSRWTGEGQIKSLVGRFKDRFSAINMAAVKRVAEELWAHRGESLVLVGGPQSQTVSSVEAQVVANLINTVLENDGKTIDAQVSPQVGYAGSYGALDRLAKDIASGEIKTLIVNGVNPLYANPRGLELEKSFKALNMMVYVGVMNNEMGRLSNFVATDHHPLENWGDLESQKGVYSIQQPTIRPLYNTRSFQDSLIAWSKAAGQASGRLGAASWHEYLKNNWKNSLSSKSGSIKASSSEDFWQRLLQTGVFDTTGGLSGKHAGRSFRMGALEKVVPHVAAEIELALYSNIGLRDGSMANVSWLQEFPDPVTKICWDNYLCVSPKNAKEWALREGTVVKLTLDDQSIEVPVHVQPGQASGSVSLAVGYGQQYEGKLASGVGVNAYALARFASGRWITSGLSAKIEKTGKSYELACTQGHHSMEGRQIVVEQTVAQYMDNASSNIHKHKIFSLYPGHKYEGIKWGMVIDLNTCTGCSACMIACQSENNIPVVGKKYVLKGREMHWIRTDRYYVGDPDDPDVVYQPMLCQHCDNAPCEAVCPVAATVHGPEGTNDMIYNRCVGTRYCSNNCPYKVRRFNWFDYVKKVEKPLNYALNPEVTVRDRGVMEKCTFCTHRIHTARSQARVEKREMKASDVQAACAQSCPAGSIYFGDLNDPNSQVAKLFKEAGNAYGVLEEWGTYPAVKYQTKIRNTTKLKGEHGHGGGHHGKPEPKEKGHHS